jgi:hypothetical protein
VEDTSERKRDRRCFCCWKQIQYKKEENTTKIVQQLLPPPFFGSIYLRSQICVVGCRSKTFERLFSGGRCKHSQCACLRLTTTSRYSTCRKTQYQSSNKARNKTSRGLCVSIRLASCTFSELYPGRLSSTNKSAFLRAPRKKNLATTTKHNKATS